MPKGIPNNCYYAALDCDSVWQKYFSTDTVKVNSAEKITVFLRGGVQVEQDMLSFR